MYTFPQSKIWCSKGFFHLFRNGNHYQNLSASYIVLLYGVTETAARLFMHKVRDAMASSGNHPMDGDVHVDEFVLGGKDQGKTGRSYDSEKKKVVTAFQLTEDGKVKPMYAMRIENFSAESLQYIFVNHISHDAKVTSDKWRGVQAYCEGLRHCPG